jgi:hypothetical protein
MRAKARRLQHTLQPTQQAALVAGQGAFTGPARSLLPEERRLLVTIFGESINLDVVRLAPTELGVQGRPYTLGNTIRIPRGTRFKANTLVHEMTHVWQFQTKGTGYLSDSALHQLVLGDAAYDVSIVAGQSLDDYSAEQQAMIVEKYYQDNPPGSNKNPELARMLSQNPGSHRLSDQDISQETSFGATRPDSIASPSSGLQGPSCGTVPLIRIEF